MPGAQEHTNILKSKLALTAQPLTRTGPPPHIPLEIADLAIDGRAPLVIVDVDEVMALFMRAFEAFVGRRGLEMRITRYALFENIYRAGEVEHLDVAAGRALFDAFFQTAAEDIEVAPGAARALASLAEAASVVILTNAPADCRAARRRWLDANALPYPLIVNRGLKGPPVAALAARTRGRAAFVDDLLPHLESVAEAAPGVGRFQMVADERLRPLAPSDPQRHQRLDDWPALAEAVAASLDIGARRP